MFKYLFINEDFEITGSNEEPTEDDLQACDDGILTIIRTVDQKTYFDESWNTINPA